MLFYRTIITTIAVLAVSGPLFANNTLAPDKSVVAVQSNPKSATIETKVNINTATVADLMKIKGMNASKSRAIVSYRKKNGNFSSVNDLSKVKGFLKIKEENLKAIQNQMTLG